MNNEASTAQEVHRVDTGKIYKDSEGNECCDAIRAAKEQGQ